MSELGDDPNKGTDFEQTLDKSVLAADLVADSAKELATVNQILHEEVQGQQSLPAVQIALDKSQAIEEKVNEASHHLSTVNTVLAEELADRHHLEQKLSDAESEREVALAAALRDALTGLPNRTLLDDRLAHGLSQASRSNAVLAVMFLDLDKFKRVNDTHGHSAGDAVLRLIAERLSLCTRDVDTVSRRGGDEFVLILWDARSKQDLERICRHILDVIAEPCDLSAFGANLPVTVTASAGVAIFPQDGADGAALIHAADGAMYAAKKNGGDGLRFTS